MTDHPEGKPLSISGRVHVEGLVGDVQIQQSFDLGDAPNAPEEGSVSGSDSITVFSKRAGHTVSTSLDVAVKAGLDELGVRPLKSAAEPGPPRPDFHNAAQGFTAGSTYVDTTARTGYLCVFADEEIGEWLQIAGV